MKSFKPQKKLTSVLISIFTFVLFTSIFFASSEKAEALDTVSQVTNEKSNSKSNSGSNSKTSSNSGSGKSGSNNSGSGKSTSNKSSKSAKSGSKKSSAKSTPAASTTVSQSNTEKPQPQRQISSATENSANINSQKKASAGSKPDIDSEFNYRDNLLQKRKDAISGQKKCRDFANDTKRQALPNCTDYTTEIENIDAELRALEQKKEKECSQLHKNFEEASKEIAKICGSIGDNEDKIGCAARVQECELKRSATDEESLGGALARGTLGALGTSYGMPNYSADMMGDGKQSRGCAELGGEDYLTQKEKIEDRLSQAQKDSTQSIKDLAEAEKDLNNDNRDTQEKISEAKNELQKNKQKMQEERAKSLSDLMEQQRQANKAIRDREMQLINIQRNLARADAKYAADLIKYSKEQGKSFCQLEVQKAKAEINKGARYGSGNSLISSGNSIKQILINQYISCMKSYDAQREAVEQEHAKEVEIQQKSYNDTQQEINELKQSLQSMKLQMAESQQAALQSQIAEEQSVMEKMMFAQKKMQDDQTNMQKRRMTIMMEQMSSAKKINNINNDLEGLVSKHTGLAHSGLKAEAEKLASAYTTACESIAGSKDSKQLMCTTSEFDCNKVRKKYLDGGYKLNELNESTK